jgi:hypothetical protein
VRLLGRLAVKELVGAVERPAGLAAEQGTDQGADPGRNQLPGAASDQRTGEPAQDSAPDGATRLLLSVLLPGTA